MPRPSRKNQFLESARSLAQERGFSATTIDALCERAGLTKGAFFHYFQSKDDFGVEVLAHFRAAGMAASEKAAFRQETDPRKRLAGYLDHLATLYSDDPFFRDGCLFAIFTLEHDDPNSPIRQFCAASLADWQAAAADELRAIFALLPQPPAVDAESLAEHLLAIIEGALIVARDTPGRQPIRGSMEHFRRYVEALMGQPAPA